MTDLHIQVAKALGLNPREDGWYLHPDGTWEPVPRYDTDWSATGPLIDKYGLALIKSPETGAWCALSGLLPWAGAWAHEYYATHPDPLYAICQLLTFLGRDGKL